MASIFDKSLTPDFAKQLLKECAEAGILHIPIRWLRLDKGHQHWAKGHLIGFHGKSLIVRPLTSSHKIDVEIPFTTAITLWTSKMSQQQIELIRKLKLKSAINSCNKPTNKEILIMPPIKTASTVISAAIGGVGTSIPNTVETNTVEPLPTQQKELDIIEDVPAPQPEKIRSTFAENIATFLSLKKQLQKDSETEGVALLKRLFADHNDALALAENIKQDMLPIVEMLKQVDVTVPAEILSLIHENKPVEDNQDAPESPESDVRGKKIVPDRHNNWCSRIAAELEPKIVQFLRQNPTKLYKGKEILAGIGFDRGTLPGTIMGPLVLKGVLDQYGRFHGCRYCLGEMAK